MKKRFLALSILVVLVLTIGAQAVELRSVTSRPALSFSGTTAYCSVECGGKSTDTVRATLTLYQGTTRVGSWSKSGTGSVFVDGSCSVERGKSYKLVVTHTINGKSQSSDSITKTCP